MLMSEDFLQTVCCSSCGSVLSNSFGGTKSYVRCPKCQAELYYEAGKHGATIKIIKEPKNPPVIPAVPT